MHQLYTPKHRFGKLHRALPSMLGGSQQDIPASTETLENQFLLEEYQRRMAVVAQLAIEGKIADGDGTAILVSDIGEEGDTDHWEFQEHKKASLGLRHALETRLGIGATRVAIRDQNTIQEVLDDPGIANVIYVGHADRSGISTPESGGFTWVSGSDPTHLKQTLGIFGCGSDDKGLVEPRFGTTFVHPEGIIYGVEGEYMNPGDEYDFHTLHQLVQPRLVTV